MWFCSHSGQYLAREVERRAFFVTRLISYLYSYRVFMLLLIDGLIPYEEALEQMSDRAGTFLHTKHDEESVLEVIDALPLLQALTYIPG